MTSANLPNHIRTTLNQLSFFSPHTLLVVAVSGGTDSLCLLHVLWQLRDEQGPALHVAHLDHGFRGEQSAAEAKTVAHIVNEWDIPATIESFDVPSLVAATGENKQTAARRVRYAFLAQVAQNVGAAGVVVAHHADDQAETVLLHLLHGAGPAGLRGMRLCVPWHEWAQPSSPIFPLSTLSCSSSLIRPMLSISRSEIEHYCTEHRLTPQYDPSNAVLSYTRNRIRAELLPLMTSYNQQIVAALARTAKICAEDYAYIQQQLDSVWNENLVKVQPGGVTFFKQQWASLAIALQRYALRRAVASITGSDDLSYEHIEIARTATCGPTGTQHTLGSGVILQVAYDRFVIFDPGCFHDEWEQSLPQLAEKSYLLTVPGVTHISADWSVEVTMIQPDFLPQQDRWRWWIVLDGDALDGTLMMRRRQPGDRFRPAGGHGSRLLQDFLVDQKVPRAVRDALPILATPTHLVWVAGLRADARFHATENTTNKVWVVLQRRISPHL